jgi:hypothetical protein
MSDETFPTWPRPDVPSADILDAQTESAWCREGDDLYRHLHEAEAEHFGWPAEPEPVKPDGAAWERWPIASVPALALAEAFDYYSNHQHELYGRDGDVIGWTYWAVRDMRNLLNGLLERHDVWRRQAPARGYPTPPTEGDDDGEVPA